MQGRDRATDLRRLLARPASAGVVCGAVAFVAALVPSLIPRSDVMQGVAAGLAFAIGYGAGVGLTRIAQALQLVGARQDSPSRAAPPAAFAAVVVAAGLWMAPRWQNGVRAAMDMPPLETHHPFVTAAVAVTVALVCILIGRLFRLLWTAALRTFGVVLPANAATALGLLLAIAVTWSLASGVVARRLVRMLDAGYARLDAFLPPHAAAPADELRSGGPASLISWSALGAQGRAYVGASPDKAAIEALTGAAARAPIRVYVGLNAARNPRARAQLALAELQRVKAFERANLVISTPTGTGWVDPAAIAPLEYLLHGDVATVSVQYSYLPSWLSLLVEPEIGAETARQVFRAVYGHWASLPAARRPRLYLFGLSLGALNSDLAVDIYDILAAPYQGALWVGPPFRSRTWREAVEARNPGTPVWRPRYSDGRMFRFATQRERPDDGYGAWGPLRVVYLQYPSDPIVFFETGSLFRRPRIAESPLPPDVAADFAWFPVVSFVQNVIDMMTATSAPRGYGHVYAARHYVDAWATLLDPAGWGPDRLDELKRRLTAEGL